MTNTKQLFTIAAIAAASLLSAGAAFAQEATPDTWLQGVQSSQTRAEVSADLAAARQSGLTKRWSAGFIEPVRHSALRTEVRAATVQALRSGEVKAINAEAQGDTARSAATALILAAR